MANPWGMSLLVGLGGFAGSVARYGLSVASQRYSIEPRKSSSLALRASELFLFWSFPALRGEQQQGLVAIHHGVKALSPEPDAKSHRQNDGPDRLRTQLLRNRLQTVEELADAAQNLRQSTEP